MVNNYLKKYTSLLLSFTFILYGLSLQPYKADALEASDEYRQPDIYLSDLEWDSAKSEWSSTKKDRSIDNNPFTVAGKNYAKGLGSHANSEIVYTLVPSYKRFVSVVGIDDEVKRDPNYVKAKAKFIVKIDGQEIAASPDLVLGETFVFDIAIPEGAKKITLIGDSLGDNVCDHVNWLDAGFILAGSDEVKPSNPVAFAGPDGNITGVVESKEGRMVYSLLYKNKPVIETSSLGVFVDGLDVGNKVELGEPVRESPEAVAYPWLGGHSTATDHHTLTRIPVTNVVSGMQYTLEVKAYSDGMAFRYVIPEGTGERAISGESTRFTLPADSKVWYQQDIVSYEGKYTNTTAKDVAAGTKIGPPLTIKLPGNLGYAAITEGALMDYAGMSLLAEGGSVFKASFNNGGPWKLSGDVKSPWRIISVAPDLNGLVNSDIVPNTAPERSQIFDATGTDWIVPGTSTWSWLGGGGVTPATLKRYIDLAAELGIPYTLIDEGWTNWGTSTQTYWEVLKEVIDYGNERGVKSWVWKAVPDRAGVKGIFDKDARQAFFQKMVEVGAVGVKVDFIDGEEMYKTNFYRDALEEAAQYHLMVDFHGSNKPTGLSRTYPNELTREGIHGLEQGAASASHTTTLPFTRLLAGHADYTPVSFTGKLGANSWSNQLATALTYTSPALFFGEHPENMLSNPAVELIKSIPTVWDETIVLPGSEIGEVSAFARRSGTTWYIAVINGLNEKNMNIDLSFLDGGSYNATIYADDMANKEGYARSDIQVGSQDKLEVQMRASGGYVAKLSKLDMEPYGGGFLSKRKIYLKSANEQSDIRYTLDGSEPTEASPKYENYIEISQPGVVRAKIIAGEGAGSDIRATFNRTSPYLTIKHDGGGREWVAPGGKVSFETNAEGSDYEIRYTLDGTMPDQNSTLYTGPFSLSVSTAELQAKLFVEGYPELEAVKKTLYTFDYRKANPALPDIYLDSLDWVSATSGWTAPLKNKSVDGNPLIVAGKTYEHGIGTHANSDIVYKIPEGAKRFVAIVGGDEEVEEAGGYASMLFYVYADNQLLDASPLIGKGHYWNFNVALPAGAKELRLSLRDNGNKNYDHGDWVNAGFLTREATSLNGPSTVSGEETFTVSLGLNGLSKPTYAQDIRIKYDREHFEFISAESAVEGVGILETLHDSDAGTLRFIVASHGAEHALTDDLQLLKLTFKSKAVTEDATAAIVVTEAVLADDQGDEINAAESGLEIAIQAPDKGIPGDINGDGRVSIGDLALIAAHYGKTSESADWAQVKHADLNKDGRIDLEDLVEVARLILE